MRIDIWDVQKPTPASDLDCGYARNFKEIFDVGRKLGKGGFGTVNVVTEKATGKEYACKSIKKRLEVLNVSAERQAQHLDNIDREATVLRRLRGTLSVAYLKGVWEDEENVHLVMEYCRGGELHHSIGQRVYTEETVARYLHQVLQCIAQCHHQRILHRDIKPGNFLLLDDTDMSPIKAIDFGLAVFYDPEKLPRTDLGLEGTPWFMAPEVLSSQTYPASDVWSAGVLCYQLLCGYLPFDDRKNPDAPALSTVWHAILTEEPSMRRSSWKNISEEAKKFVVNLLIKDPAKRPTAKEALQHCWLQSSFHKDRSRPLSSTVVQRIQRFAQTNLLKRTVFELIASELLKIVPPHLSDPSKSGGTEALESLEHQPSTFADSDMSEASDDNKASCEDSEHVGGVFSMSPEKPTGSPPQVVARQRRNSIDVPSHHHLTSIRKRYHPKSASMKFSPSLEQISALARAASRTGAATVHGPGEYWRILRQASELAALESGHGRMDYLRAAARSEDEKQEQKKAARLSLDTSAHGGSRYQELLSKLEEEGSHRGRKLPVSKSTGNLNVSNQESARRPFVRDDFPTLSAEETRMDTEDNMELGGRGRSAALMALRHEQQGQQEDAKAEDEAVPLPGRGPITVRRVSFNTRDQILDSNVSKEKGSNAVTKSNVERVSGMAITSPKDLESLMRNLQFKSSGAISSDALAHGLRQLGYDVNPAEMGVLLNQLGVSEGEESIRPAEFVASLLDWGGFQRGNRELWLECARRAFMDLDVNSDGKLTAEDIIAKLRDKLPAEEVDFAVEDAFLDAGGIKPEDVDFEGFLRIMRVGSQESSEALDLYDPRILQTKQQEDGQDYRLDTVLE